MTTNKDRPNKSKGAFAREALTLLDYRLSPIPTGGDDGKRPLVTGYPKGARPSYDTIKKWMSQYDEANVAIVCGKSNIIVVDVDDPALLPKMLERFGDTPLICLTGRGRYQLYYRAVEGVQARNLRSTERIEVEIKAGGNIVVVPPSKYFPTGREYAFHRGDWNSLIELPDFHDREEAQSPRHSPPTSAMKAGLNDIGTRNNQLFSYLLGIARECESFDELRIRAIRYNLDRQSEPEPDEDVMRTAHQVWRYEHKGLNFRTTPSTVIPHGQFDLFTAKGDDLALNILTFVKRHHGARIERGDEIYLCAEKLAKDQRIAGVRSRKTLKNGIDRLVELGFFRETTLSKGVPRSFIVQAPPVKYAHNVTDMPPPYSEPKTKKQDSESDDGGGRSSRPQFATRMAIDVAPFNHTSFASIVSNIKSQSFITAEHEPRQQ